MKEEEKRRLSFFFEKTSPPPPLVLRSIDVSPKLSLSHTPRVHTNSTQPNRTEPKKNRDHADDADATAQRLTAFLQEHLEGLKAS